MTYRGLNKTQQRSFLSINKMILKPFLTIFLLGLASGQKSHHEMLDKFFQKFKECEEGEFY